MRTIRGTSGGCARRGPNAPNGPSLSSGVWATGACSSNSTHLYSARLASGNSNLISGKCISFYGETIVNGWVRLWLRVEIHNGCFAFGRCFAGDGFRRRSRLTRVLRLIEPVVLEDVRVHR